MFRLLGESDFHDILYSAGVSVSQMTYFDTLESVILDPHYSSRKLNSNRIFT